VVDSRDTITLFARPSAAEITNERVEMRAKEEIANLVAKLDSGDLPFDEPIFVLRARDILSVPTLKAWISMAKLIQASPVKIETAERFIPVMQGWAFKRRPGCPETEAIVVEGDHASL